MWRRECSRSRCRAVLGGVGAPGLRRRLVMARHPHPRSAMPGHPREEVFGDGTTRCYEPSPWGLACAGADWVGASDAGGEACASPLSLLPSPALDRRARSDSRTLAELDAALRDREAMGARVVSGAASLDDGERVLELAVPVRVTEHEQVVGDGRESTVGDAVRRVD